MKRRYFFITGLPRSKTAWLANYLTYGESFCYHDELQHYATLEAFCKMLETTPATIVGHSDPANILVWEQLHKRFPEAIWVVIRRDFDECYHASRRLNPTIRHERFWALNQELERLCRELKPVELPFDQPYLGEAVGAATFALAPNTRRAELLEHLQVQVEPTYLRNRINQLQQAAA